MDTNSIYDQALAEHQEIKKIIHRLLEMIHNKPGMDTVDAAGVLEIFSELSNHLKIHFSIEEDGGFMDPVLAFRPQAAALVQSLKSEHVEMLGLCDQGMQTLSGNLSTPSAKDHAFKIILDLVKKLENHEREEDDLIQSVYVNDLGTKD